MRLRTLRARVVVAVALSIVLAITVLGAAVEVLVGRHLHRSLDLTLRNRAADVARLAVSAPTLLTAPGALDSPLGGRDLSVEVLDRQGRIVGRSLAPAGQGVVLLVASLAVYVVPLAGIACFGLLLSTVTRNSAASVVGTLMFALLMQLIGALPGTEPIRPYLLSTQFSAWHGFLRTPADWEPVIRAFWVCALYVAAPLAGAYLVFLRRDVAGE